MSSAPTNYTERFQQYFSREVAQKAAKSLSNGVEMEFQIQAPTGTETFTFTKVKSQNQVVKGPAQSPQVQFTLTFAAADQILGDGADDIGQIGVNIAKMILAGDADKKVSFKIKAGFLSLMTQGYFGVVTAGGAAFASFLASHGLNGLGAIKAAFQKLKH